MKPPSPVRSRASGNLDYVNACGVVLGPRVRGDEQRKSLKFSFDIAGLALQDLNCRTCSAHEHDAETLSSPGLSRRSRLGRSINGTRNRDGRDKPGHDEIRFGLRLKC